MDPLNILEIKKDDIHISLMDYPYLDTIKVVQKIKFYIENLYPIRHSKIQTETLISEIEKEMDYPKKNIITHWIFICIKDDSSFIYAYNYLNRLNNIETGVPSPPKDFNETELLMSLEAPKPNKKRFIIKNDQDLNNIYLICEQAFTIDYDAFRERIETAKFNISEIKKLNIVQDLVYRLQGILGKEWYTEVCKNMNWPKPVVSGKKQKLESNLLIRKLDKILPRPKRE